MKAIEINSKTDKKGHLKLDVQLHRPDGKVRVLILMEDEGGQNDEEQIWLEAISKNPVFNFLNDPAENLYSLNDGEPFDD